MILCINELRTLNSVMGPVIIGGGATYVARLFFSPSQPHANINFSISDGNINNELCFLKELTY